MANEIGLPAWFGQAAAMDVPGRVGRFGLLPAACPVADVLIDGAGNHVEIQPLGALRLVVHELRQRLVGGA